MGHRNVATIEDLWNTAIGRNQDGTDGPTGLVYCYNDGCSQKVPLGYRKEHVRLCKESIILRRSNKCKKCDAICPAEVLKAKYDSNRKMPKRRICSAWLKKHKCSEKS